jgi:hypothetical protein
MNSGTGRHVAVARTAKPIEGFPFLLKQNP